MFMCFVLPVLCIVTLRGKCGHWRLLSTVHQDNNNDKIYGAILWARDVLTAIGDIASQVWTQVIKEPVVREADVKNGYDGYGNLRWRYYLISKLLTLMLLITLVHLKPSWSLELKRRRGSMSRL